MSLESRELEASNDVKLDACERMRIKAAKLQSMKETVDEDVKWLEKELDSLSNYLKTYSRVKVDILRGLHARRLRTRKLVPMSLAISASSLTLCLRSNHVGGMKDAMPWVIGLGAASLAFSLFYLRDFLLSFRNPCSKWEAIEAEVNKEIERPVPILETIKPVDESEDKSISEQIKTDFEDLEMPRTKRIASS